MYLNRYLSVFTLFLFGVNTLPKLITSSVLSSYASAEKINSNFNAVDEALENTISRNGDAPNNMEADLDLDSNNVINLGEPTLSHHATTKAYVDAAVLTASGVDTGLFITQAEFDATIAAIISDVEDQVDAALVDAADDILLQTIVYTPNYATLAAITNPVQGKTYWTGARANFGDGGEGPWIYFNTRRFTPDDGVCINCTVGGQFWRSRDFKHFDASWYGCAGGNLAPANTVGMQACCAAVQAANGGKITISGGSQETILIYDTAYLNGSGTQHLGNFTNCPYIELDFTGKNLYIVDTMGAGEFQRIFQFNNCEQINVPYMKGTHASHATHTVDRGVDWLYITGPTKICNINLISVGGYTGVDYTKQSIANGEDDTPSGVFNVNINSYITSYPCSIQSGVMGLNLQLWADRPVRSFLNHGHIGRLNAKITSRDFYAQDILLHSDGKASNHISGANPLDWTIDYYKRPDSGNVSPVGSQCIIIGTRGDSKDHHWKALNLKAYVDGISSTGVTAVTWFAQDDSDVEIALIGDMPGIIIDDLDLDIYVDRVGPSNAIDFMYDVKWNNTVIKRARLNLVGVDSTATGTPQILMNWTPIQTLVEANFKSDTVQFIGQRPVGGANDGPFSYAGVTPVWKGSTGDPAIGNGTISAFLTKKSDEVTVNIYVTMGSTTTYGTGDWYFTLPAPWNFNARVSAVGTALLADNGTGRFVGIANINAGDNKIYIIPNSGVANGSATVPFTWANGDGIIITLTYMRSY